MKVAVIAHAGKTLDGGLPELRRSLDARGGRRAALARGPQESQGAGAGSRRALEEGAELIFVWGGDGMVQRCVDVLAGSSAQLAIVPAGTANLFATNLGIPRDIEGAVEVGLHGERRALDVGSFNGERFAVMAGAGFDAAMIRDAGGLKDRIGRAAYVWSGSQEPADEALQGEDQVDGAEWYKGQATCILLGNVGDAVRRRGGFRGRAPDDGLLDLGVVTAEGAVAAGRARSRARPSATPQKSPFVRVDQGALGEGQARSQGPLRARRRRSHQGQGVQGRRSSPARSRLRPARPREEERL